MGGCSIAVVGATGAVGQVFLRVLEERRFPASSIRLLASRRSAGKRIRVMGQELQVEEATPDSFRGVDIAFISVSAAASRQLAPAAVQAGALVIDDSSAFRMDPQVPLVVPEVNADDLEGHRGITAIPNCSTTPMVMALYPLHLVNPVRRIIVDTYQSVSGTGAEAVEELREQAGAVLAGRRVTPGVYPHQIAFNVLPQVDGFRPDGYTIEEWKMVEETRKVMHAPEIAISATCVRVPVYVSHSLAVHVELTRPMTPLQARQLMSEFPGVRVVDDPPASAYPMPWTAADTNDVLVGRIRQDASHPNGLAFWAVSDNLRKGAALNAIQIAEAVLERGLLPAGERRT